MKKILVVEDQENIVELIKFNLEQENYIVTAVMDGKRAIEEIKSNSYDLVLLDISIPKINGLEVLRKIRNNDESKALPVILLTARSSELDKVLGLEIGADDYITKPFSIRELMARIKVQLRRFEQAIPISDEIIVGDIKINISEFTAFKGDRKLELTLKEFNLLKELISNPGRLLTRDYLLETIWGYEYMGETRTVDVHIRHLRRKLEDDDVIITVRGMGYKLEDV